MNGTKHFNAAFDGESRVSDVEVFTLVIWIGCVTVGILGFLLPYGRPQPVAPPPEPVKFEMLDVKLSDQPRPADQPPPNRGDAKPAEVAPAVPQAVPVAESSPAIAFAVPVEGPVQIVARQEAAYVRPTVTPATSAPAAPQRLVFGEGEGSQPKPEYPTRAKREGQEGAVLVRFTVGENGEVQTVENATPSPWPLLNESALHTVKARWHFPPGKFRAYEIWIRFELTH